MQPTDEVEITTLMNGEFLVGLYGKKSVFIKYDNIVRTSQFDKFWNKYFIEPALKKNEVYSQGMKDAIQKFGKRFGPSIYLHEVTKGMNPGMVVESIGAPKSKIHSTTDYGDTDAWFYGKGNVYFTNGVVSGWDIIQP